jgi:hypothetical protein
MLELQTKERSEIFKRRCLFCNKMWYKRYESALARKFAVHSKVQLLKNKLFFFFFFASIRDDLFQHMFAEHHFNIGRPDNLVNIQELLDILQQKIDAYEHCTDLKPTAVTGDDR